MIKKKTDELNKEDNQMAKSTRGFCKYCGKEYTRTGITYIAEVIISAFSCKAGRDIQKFRKHRLSLPMHTKE